MAFDPQEGARISSALIKAITEAKALADAGDVGLELRDLVRHARDLCGLLLEQLIAAEPDAVDDVRGMWDAMGDRLVRLESLLGDGSCPSTVH